MIYVMQGRDDRTKIKIGITSVSFAMRKRGLETGHGAPLTVLHGLVGGRTEELALHRRFAASKVNGTNEWFLMTPAVIEWLATLEPIVQSEPRETALDWLGRVGTDRARQAIDSWTQLQEHACKTGSKSHTLWDMLSGAKGKLEPLFSRNGVYLKGRTFYFPIFAEACIRQGSSPPNGSTVAHVRPKSHRTTQPNRWGAKLRAAQ